MATPPTSTNPVTAPQLAAPDEDASLGAVTRRVLQNSGGPVGVAATAAPLVAFVVADTVAGLTAAVVALAVTAAVAFAVRLVRRESLRGALIGLVVAGVCALVAALTGEARAFFLLPTLLPAGFVLLFLGSLVIRRPLTGILFNRLAGGPHNWPEYRPLRRVYSLTTLLAAVANAINFAVHVVFYRADEPAILAVIQIAVGPVMATLAAFTVIAARRTVASSRPW